MQSAKRLPCKFDFHGFVVSLRPREFCRTLPKTGKLKLASH
jgi:hypothetical protein